MTKYDRIPYPPKEEIQKQIECIINKSFPERKSFFSQIQSFYREVGLRHLLPNRNEWIFTAIAIVFILLFTYLALDNENKIFESNYIFLFMLSPFLFASLSLYSFYAKREMQTFELEMTTKYTVFQLIGLRMLTFSSIAILCNMSISLWLSYAYEQEFFRLWLLSLTGLFVFAVGLLAVMKSGQIIPRITAYIICWTFINCVSIMFAETTYIQFLLTLPTFIYAILVILLAWLFLYTFKAMFLRKQEGITLC